MMVMIVKQLSVMIIDMMIMMMMTRPGNQSAKENMQEHCIGRWLSRRGSFGASSSFMIIKFFWIMVNIEYDHIDGDHENQQKG